MTTEQEKRISAIREAQNLRNSIVSLSSYNRDVYDLLEIVDSQAQKIAGHEKTINEQADVLADFEDLYKVLIKYHENDISYSSLGDAIDHFKAMRG